MNYSLLKSRTFWTIVAMAIIGAGNAIDPVIPFQYQAILETVLTILASYFHLETAKNVGASN